MIRGTQPTCTRCGVWAINWKAEVLNIHSVFVKITAIFLLIIVLVTFSFYSLINIEVFKQSNLNASDMSQSARSMLEVLRLSGDWEQAREIFLKGSMREIDPIEWDENVLKKGERFAVLEVPGLPHMMIFRYGDQSYGTITYEGKQYFFENTQAISITKWWLGLGAILFLLLLAYISVLRSLLPLLVLREKMERFAKGDLSVECAVSRRDEIGAVANVFDRAVKRLRELTESRQLFVRNIMHELKTPITKGRLALEMMEESPSKTRLKKIFERQEELIQDFAQIDRFISDVIVLEKESYRLIDLIEHALDLLMVDEGQVQVEVNGREVEVDYDLFVIAIKNLIDNGLKYSSDNKVLVLREDNALVIKNRGKALEHSLESYSQPFFLRGSKQKESRGLGFGLYIIQKIISLHTPMKLTYQHDREWSTFRIVF